MRVYTRRYTHIPRQPRGRREDRDMERKITARKYRNEKDIEEPTLLESIEKTLDVKIHNQTYWPEVERNWREGISFVVYGDPNEFWAETVASNTRESAMDLLDTIAQECWHCDWPTDDPNYIAFLVDIDGDAIQLTGESRLDGVTPIGITSGF